MSLSKFSTYGRKNSYLSIDIDIATKYVARFTTSAERGIWLSLYVAFFNNNGVLKNDKNISKKCQIYTKKDTKILKQLLNQLLGEIITLDDNNFYHCDQIKYLINRDKYIKDVRSNVGKKGGINSVKKRKNVKENFKQLLTSNDIDSILSTVYNNSVDNITILKNKKNKYELSSDDIALLGTANWYRKRDMFGRPEYARKLEIYEKLNGEVTWTTEEEYYEMHRKK